MTFLSSIRLTHNPGTTNKIRHLWFKAAMNQMVRHIMTIDSWSGPGTTGDADNDSDLSSVSMDQNLSEMPKNRPDGIIRLGGGSQNSNLKPRKFCVC